MSFKDLEKRRSYRRKWYSENKKSEIAHVRRRRKIKGWLSNYKKCLKCEKCKEKHPAIIDFHHDKGNKEKGISRRIIDGHSIEKVKIEIQKCQILCSNCHRKIHFKNTKTF